MKHIRVMLLTAVAASLCVSCGKKSASDSTLRTDIQAKLYADAVTKPASVNVAVSNGVVTLSGDVPSSDVELEAMKIANGTSGVKSVNDQMKINAALATAQIPNAAAPAPQTPASYPPVSSAPANPAPAAPTEPPPAQPPLPPPATAAPVQPASVTIPAGEHVTARMIDSINSATNTAGQVFRATLYSSLTAHGRVIVPAGARASVLLANARDAGRIKGNSELEVRLSRIDYRGRWYPVDSSIYEEAGKARGKQTAVRTGIGAAAGAVIGAIAGGGKGAAIGSAAGGGVGFGTDLFTHGQQVKIPSESILTFRLRAPLTIQE